MKFWGRTLLPARKARNISGRISGRNSEQISEKFSETSFQISRLFSETSFSRRAALRRFDRTVLGRSPISGSCFKVPSTHSDSVKFTPFLDFQ